MKSELTLLMRLLSETAASELMPGFQRTRAERKLDGSLVTAVDLASQRCLGAALEREFPGIPLLGEEMDGDEQARLLREAANGVWVLDPLDGTSNYVNGFPGFAISLALVAHGEPVLGAILDPLRNECFTAARKEGAFLNGEPIRPYAIGPDLEGCLAMIDLKRLPTTSLAAIFRPGGFGSQRNLGSVALDWCWLAAGRCQLYLHGAQKLWDYAAGRLIADEAGAAWQQYRTDGVALAKGLDLDPRLAVAAANEVLLERWLDFLDLPWKRD